jgi:hypothetical protein
MKSKLIIFVASFAMSVVASNAQTVSQRQENQQDRVAAGIKDNQLTPGETAKVERQESNINKQVHADRALNGAKLTPGERAQANKELNRTSAEIHNDRTNNVAPKYGNNKVDQRRENQQHRIAQGVTSGSLSAGKTAKLESQEARINKQVRNDRNANGGRLNGWEKKQVNKEQNRESARIYRAKH